MTTWLISLTACRFRGVSRRVGESWPAVPRPILPRDLDARSEVPRRIDRALLALARSRSTFAVSGWALRVLSFHRHRKVSPNRHSSLRVALLLEALTTCQPHSHAHGSAPLLRFRPLQRSTETGVRMTRRIHPPAPSVFADSHRLDVLLRP
jgi:hypothetical protein